MRARSRLDDKGRRGTGKFIRRRGPPIDVFAILPVLSEGFVGRWRSADSRFLR
jgi:hypothetical protein